MTQSNSKTKLALAIGAGAAVLAAMGVAEATTGTGTMATAFDDLTLDVQGLLNGSLGKTISALFVVVGIVAGVARQSLMPFAIGGGAGVGLNAAPGVINTMFSATQGAAIDLQITGANLGLM